jgi:hypothetical protein
MSMPIQRQSEAYSIFDDGPRFARDRSSTDLPSGLAGLVNSMGPRITGGLLNTRQAGTDSYPTPEHLWEGQGPDRDENGRPLRNSNPSEVEHFSDAARALRSAGYPSDGPRDHGGAGPDGGPSVPDSYYDDDDDFDGDPKDPPGTALEDPWGHRASRHPFDRLAETSLPRGSDRCQWCGDQKPTNRWQGAPSHDGVSLKSRSEDVCPDCVDAIPHKDEYQRFVDENHNGRHGRQAFNDFHNKTKMGSDDLWSWSNWMEGIQQQGHAAHDLEHAWESDLRNNRNGLDQLIRPHRWEASRHPFDRTAACQSCGGEVYHISGEGFVHDDTDDHDGWKIDEHHQAEPDDDDNRNLGLSSAEGWNERKGRRVALAPAPQDAAMAPQMPVGGGFLPGHRVGLDWRDRTIPGTVIANDGQVHIRWDEGQYTSEDPTEVRLL